MSPAAVTTTLTATTTTTLATTKITTLTGTSRVNSSNNKNVTSSSNNNIDSNYDNNIGNDKNNNIDSNDNNKNVVSVTNLIQMMKKNNRKTVRHHNHLTGQYYGSSHNSCNLNCKQNNYLPVAFHNLRGYDSHLIMQSVGLFKDRNIKCLANNMERYISFSLGPLRFIDTLQFMNSSLDKLVENLKLNGKHSFKLFYEDFPDTQHADLLLRKGVFPYEYIDSIERLTEQQLPPRECFYSNLTKETVSIDDYEHACNVFNCLHMPNLEAYMRTYVKSDVSLLACVFEEFRNVCMKQYNLDPAHFYGAPGLSWSACLKMTGMKLELLTDIDMVLFLEKGIRGGVSQVSHRFKQANNPYVEGFDCNKATSYCAYEDAVNLYAFSMQSYLPCSL